jgi:uncharacterized RDD family membrane protein YckC
MTTLTTWQAAPGAPAQFVTGEAVPLELPIARIPSRATAYLCDVLVQVFILSILLPVVVLSLITTDLDLAWVTTASLVSLVAVLVGYPVLCETLSRGQTPGKMILGIRVVRADGAPIDFRHALTRGLTGALVDFWGMLSFGLVAAVVASCDRQSRRVGDLLAGTLVIVADPPLPMPKLAVAPPWLAAWVAPLNVTAIPDDLARATRQYLIRYRELAPEISGPLGEHLARRVCAQLGAPIPPGSTPLTLLGSVIAERQRREILVAPRQ